MAGGALLLIPAHQLTCERRTDVASFEERLVLRVRQGAASILAGAIRQSSCRGKTCRGQRVHGRVRCFQPVARIGAELGCEQLRELGFGGFEVGLREGDRSDSHVVVALPRLRGIVERCIVVIQIRNPTELEVQRPGALARVPVLCQMRGPAFGTRARSCIERGDEGELAKDTSRAHDSSPVC